MQGSFWEGEHSPPPLLELANLTIISPVNDNSSLMCYWFNGWLKPMYEWINRYTYTIILLLLNHISTIFSKSLSDSFLGDSVAIFIKWDVKLQNAFLSLKLRKMLWKERIQNLGGVGGLRMLQDSATLSSAVHVERAMPPNKLHIDISTPPSPGPNPEINPVMADLQTVKLRCVSFPGSAPKVQGLWVQSTNPADYITFNTILCYFLSYLICSNCTSL